MAAKTNHLPACRHVEIGGQLQEARNQLLHLVVELSNAYPLKSKQVRAASQAQKALDELRNVLDSVSADELPEAGWASAIYYRGNPDLPQVDVARVLEVHRADNPPCCAGREEAEQ